MKTIIPAMLLKKPHVVNTRRVVGFTLWGLGFLLLLVSSVIVHFHPGPWSFDLQTTVTVQHLQISNAMSNLFALVSIVDDPIPAIVGVILGSIVLALIGVFVWRRGASPLRWFVTAIFIFAGTALAAVLDWVFSTLVDRPRPASPLIHIYRTAPTHSFPSGHVENDVVYLGFLLYLSLSKPISQWRYRWIFIPFQVYAMLNILLIGYSRVYEGSHWLTDASGGYFAGALWLSALIFLYRWTMDTLTKRCERKESMVGLKKPGFQTLDLSSYRHYFPSLELNLNGKQAIFFDNPGGTQVARQVIDAMVTYFREANANTGGAFVTSQRTDALITAARSAMADFLHAAEPNSIVFGPNMTTLTFAFSRAIGRTLQAGDEIVVTVLDHDANVAPWLALQERGAVIRIVDVHPENVTLDMDDMRAKITGRTKIVAVGYASNAVGTINDVLAVIRRAHEVGALAWIDAVQFAPHGPIDVQALDADFLVCSSYKFFGPHLGILYGKAELLERFPAYKVRPASNFAPDRWETGTQNHEGLSGLLGALDYLAMLGREQSSIYSHAFRTDTAGNPFSSRQRELKIAMQAIMDYERGLSAQLLAGLREIQGLQVYGITDPQDFTWRVPTVACNIEGHNPRELAEYLASQGIFAWDGNYYASGIMERLGLEEHGGALRLGMAHYNTPEEIDRVLHALEQI